MMKVLVKIINASGFNMSLSIADIYGPTTVEQASLENTFTDHLKVTYVFM